MSRFLTKTHRTTIGNGLDRSVQPFRRGRELPITRRVMVSLLPPFFATSYKKSTPSFCGKIKNAPFSERFLFIKFFFVNRNFAVFLFKFLDAFFGKKFKLCVKGTHILFCNMGNFIKNFRFKTNSGLDFISSHDNTSF